LKNWNHIYPTGQQEFGKLRLCGNKFKKNTIPDMGQLEIVWPKKIIPKQFSFS
jgi:hypothetical protein